MHYIYIEVGIFMFLLALLATTSKLSPVILTPYLPVGGAPKIIWYPCGTTVCAKVDIVSVFPAPLAPTSVTDNVAFIEVRAMRTLYQLPLA